MPATWNVRQRRRSSVFISFSVITARKYLTVILHETVPAVNLRDAVLIYRLQIFQLNIASDFAAEHIALRVILCHI